MGGSSLYANLKNIENERKYSNNFAHREFWTWLQNSSPENSLLEDGQR
jgi:hypothetical protein